MPALPAFKKLVTEAGIEAVIGTYNRTNGERRTVKWTIRSEILELVDDNGQRRLEPGPFRLLAGFPLRYVERSGTGDGDVYCKVAVPARRP